MLVTVRSFVILLYLCYLQLVFGQNADSWIWKHDSSMDNVHFSSFLLGTGTFTDIPACAVNCLYYSNCMSFFVLTNASQPEQVGCRFHERLYTAWERTYFSQSVSDVAYYHVQSACPVTLDHFFSREARMCIYLNTGTMSKLSAADQCTLQGGQIVVLDNEEKISFILSIITASSAFTYRSYHLNAQYNGSDYVWNNGLLVSSSLLAFLTPDPPSATCLFATTTFVNTDPKLIAYPADCTDEYSLLCQLPF